MRREGGIYMYEKRKVKGGEEGGRKGKKEKKTQYPKTLNTLK